MSCVLWSQFCLEIGNRLASCPFADRLGKTRFFVVIVKLVSLLWGGSVGMVRFESIQVTNGFGIGKSKHRKFDNGFKVEYVKKG